MGTWTVVVWVVQGFVWSTHVVAPVVVVVEEVEHVGSSAVVTVVAVAHRVVLVVVVGEDMAEVKDADPDLGPMTVKEDEDLDQDLDPEADPETDLDVIRTVVALVLALHLNQEMIVRHPEIEDHAAAPTSRDRSLDPDLGLPMRTARMTVGSATATATIKLKCCYVVPSFRSTVDDDGDGGNLKVKSGGQSNCGGGRGYLMAAYPRDGFHFNK